MPKTHCNHCPIVEFCNKDPIMVNAPSGKYMGRGANRKPVMIRKRLCPLLIAISRTVPPPVPKPSVAG